ncbi:MAG TPA: TonB-dependent receptor [Vicinamibacterales bacterium]|nr:TonB-dependent receptor [Vicinamibacterales bacterium]
MRTRIVMAALMFMLAGSANAYAQQATIVGAVADESKGVLPGVTVTATEIATGRQFTSVTTARGEYRLAGLSPGKYRVEAALAGFAPSVVQELELLVGQSATIGFTLKVATLQESVTVTGESPLVDTRQSHVAGNVDRRQMEDLPISGRNWMELSLQVKGITANTISTTPGVARTASFRLNLDGQEITQDRLGSFGQGGISRDAIAEYQIVTNMFDVTMGRSVGVQVQAISRAGTNSLAGSAYGYFRDDALNAKDHFVDRVLPYSNQQVGGTLGGPIIKDKLQYFGSYEYERQPDTSVVAPAPLAPQRAEIPVETNQHYGLGRVDYQFSRSDHLTVRDNLWKWRTVEVAGHPSRVADRNRDSQMTTANWSRVVRSNLLQEIKVSYYKYHYINVPRTPTIEYVFPGLTFGANWNYPSEGFQRTVTTRGDLTWHKNTHDFKMGAELQIQKDGGHWRARERGQMFFSRLPADAATRFPLTADPSGWDFSGLDSLVTRFDVNFAAGNDWTSDVPHPKAAAWIGDSWALNNRVTLNLGLRYDAGWKDFIAPGVRDTSIVINNGLFTEDVGYRNDIRDLGNVAPRAGFTWNVTDKNDLVIHGGGGLFYSTPGGQQLVLAQLFNGQRVITSSFPNDNLPGFLQNPTRGVTAEAVLSGRVPPPAQAINVFGHDDKMPRMFQAMLGFQKQLNQVMGFDADLVYYRGDREDTQRDPNLFYDPATGLFKNPTRFGRPRADYGPINLMESRGRSDYLALASSFTRRYRDNFQLGFTHTLMFFKRDTGIGAQGLGNTQLNPFDLDDLSLDWARGTDFQRHTANANGIWMLPWSVQLSGTFHYGSGNYMTITSPVSALGTGPQRVRADLTVIPRNTFKTDPWQTLSLRLSKDLRLYRDVKLTAMAEMFNVYNYARYNRNTIEGNANFGKATSAGNMPRTGQLAFRLSW